MTGRHSGYLVTLARDIREDDAEAVIAALRMIKGVADVRPVPAHPGAAVTQIRRDLAWRQALGSLALDGPGDA